MANPALLVLTVVAVVAVSNSASSANVNARSLPSAREIVLPNTKTQPHICAVYIEDCTECIASIIHESWVLMSAFCASKIKYKQDVRVVGGVSDLDGKLDKGQIRGITNVIIKPGAVSDDFNANNVALLKLDYPFIFDKKNVQKINLPYTGAVIDSSYNVPYWEYYVCAKDPSIFHPIVILYAKKVEPSLCRLKGYDQCPNSVVCIESQHDMGPLMGPLAKADEYDMKPHELDAISMDLDLVLEDGYTPDPYHDAQAPLTPEILVWIRDKMNPYPYPQPIG